MKKLLCILIVLLIEGCARCNIQNSVYKDILISSATEIGLSKSYYDTEKELFYSVQNNILVGT